MSPSLPPAPPSGSDSPAAAALRRVEALEHEVEHVVEEVVERGERSLAARFGLGFVRGLRRVLRWTGWVLLLAYFLFGAVLLATRWWILPQIDRFRPDIEALASRATGTQIQIGAIEAGWDTIQPQFALADVRIIGQGGAAGLSLPRLEATLSWTSLLRFSPNFSSLVVRSPELSVRRLPGDRIEIAGFVIDPAQASGDRRLLDWLLSQGRVLVSDARIDVFDERSAAQTRQASFSRVELLFESGLTGWRFGLQAQPPSELAAPLDLRGKISRSPFAAAGDWRQWSGELYAGFDRVDLAQLAAWIDLPWHLTRAQGAARAWLDFERLRVTRVAADVALQDVSLQLAPDLPALELDFLRGRLSQGLRAQDEVLAASGLAFRTRDGLEFGPADLALRLAHDESANSEFTANQISVTALASLLPHFPIGTQARESIVRHALEGELSNLSLRWSGPLEQPRTYELKSDFAGLASRAQPDEAGGVGLPGFAKLAGRLEASQEGGTLVLSSREAALDFPGVFEDPRIAASELEARLRWSMKPALEVRLESLALRNADVEASGSGSWRDTGGAGSVDLSGRILRAEAASAYKYVPLVAGRDTISWLAQALRAGRASEGQWRLRGKLEDFPFTRPTQGEFRVSAKVAGVTLDYVPSGRRDASGAYVASELWPALTGIDGSLLFERESMDIRARRGQVDGVQITEAQARIPSLSENALLLIKGQAAGPLSGMVQFVNSSPVSGWLGNFLHQAEAQGPAKLDLKLEIPLAHSEASKVAGTLQLLGNDLTLAGGVPPISRAVGPLSFTEHGLRSPGVALNFLGGPGRLEASTQADGGIVLSVAGRMSPAGLRSGLDIAPLARLLEKATGETRYSGTLSLRAGALSLRAESDLVGLALNLPPPLRKTAQESWPLRVVRQPGVVNGTEADTIRVSLAQMLDVNFERVRGSGGGLQVSRGAVAVGDVANLPAYGVSLNANLNRLDLDAWLPVADNLLGPAPVSRRASAGGDEFNLDLIALRAREVEFDGKKFANMVMGASRGPDGSWRANVASDSVSGAVNWWPAARGREGRVAAQFTRLAIPDSARDDVSSVLSSASPSQLPALEVRADEFELAGKRLGRLEILALNSASEQGPIWRLQKLSIVNPDAQFSAKGQWAPEAAGTRRTSLDFLIDIRNAGGMLERLGIKEAIKAGNGKLEGEVSWRGSPLAVNYPSLDGKMSLELDRGQVLKAEPGVARLLSVFSLQSIARRLTLDFRDIFSEGFAFDSVRADANLAAGVLSTKNFRMSGAAATVLIEGWANLRSETQNLHVLVLPDINATSASVALAIANPALGLGSLLAQLVLKDPLSKLFSLEYDVTGTWADPQVRKVDRASLKP